MSTSYVVADLVRNPRRTVSTMAGVVLGVGLFCGVLFFVDGLSASMTQRAVEPLALDMQRIVTQRAGGTVEVSQRFDRSTLGQGQRAAVTIELHNIGETDAHEVTLRSVMGDAVRYVPSSARLDDVPLSGAEENPFARGPARTGRNLGTLVAGASHTVSFDVEAVASADLDDSAVLTSSSTRESVSPIAANRPPSVALAELAHAIAARPGVAAAEPLSIADLGTDALRAGERSVVGPAKIFGFDRSYADDDESIALVEGTFGTDGAVVSAEVAAELGLAVGETVEIDLPDGTAIDLPVTGVADLSRSRSLFSSRRGGDLETFIYVPRSVVVSSDRFEQVVFPAYERTAARAAGRLKAPPIREVDITLERELLDADPATAAAQTERIGADIQSIAAHQDYLLDNITNTLHVAAADARVAKRLFVFLGVPGGLLAAMLAAYAGNVLAEGQRREQATLRIRGASRRHLLRMLAARTTLLTAVAAIGGLAAGYLSAAAILGGSSLDRASTGSLVTSAAVGTVGGFVATGAALFVTGRRSIDRDIHEDRARLMNRPPIWRRYRLDIGGAVATLAGTAWAIRAGAFEGVSGSVYFGRGVELRLVLLALPIGVWVAGSLIAARLLGSVLRRTDPRSRPWLDRVVPALFRRSIGRRPWAIGNAAIVAALVVALATCLVTFTASYDAAKAGDARYANGADIRISPSPASERVFGIEDAVGFETPSVEVATPVIYGLSNVILRSDRTSDPANLAALEPATFDRAAPVDRDTAAGIRALAGRPDGILVSAEMADFLQVGVGDRLSVLLARATPVQAEVDVTIIGLFDRLPGFPDGADAVLDIARHVAAIPTKEPDLFLARVSSADAVALQRAVDEITRDFADEELHIDTRATMLDRDQSSLAALNIGGLVRLDTAFALAMAAVAVGIFVFGLLLQRRREYVTLRAQGMPPGSIRVLIGAEAATAMVAGTIAGLVIGAAMGFSFVAVLRPLFVLDPSFVVPASELAPPVLLIVVATIVSALAGSRLVGRLDPTELLRDD